MASQQNIYSEWLNYCCYLHSMTYEEVANQLGVMPGTLTMWTKGRNRPRIGMIRAMVELSGGQFKPSDLYPELMDS